jgi:hypothetical protein
MPSSHHFLYILAALTALLSARAGEAQSYEGEYFYNFENSYFVPDGKSESWCINAALMAKAMLPATDANGQWGTSHVKVRGTLGPKGSYGGLGRCSHILSVTELVDVGKMRGRE